jgi:DNA-binding Lrp family transcriptional regulator
MSEDISNYEELIEQLEELLRSRREKKTPRSRERHYFPQRYYFPTSIPDWRYAGITRGKEFVLVSTEDEIGETGMDVSQRVTALEKGFQKIICDLDEIKKKFGVTVSLKDDALREYKEKIAEVPEVVKVFYMISEEGIDFLTLFESSNRLGVLKKIVPLHVDLDRTYKEVYFDFQVNHIAEVDVEELRDWTLLYQKTP